MLAADTSTWIAFIAEEDAIDANLLLEAIHKDDIVMPPPVLSEILSDPNFNKEKMPILLSIPLLDLKIGYWQRAGLMRAHLYKKKFRPKLPDTLIAQSCIDHNVPLLARDRDFAAFERHCGLKLYKAA